MEATYDKLDSGKVVIHYEFNGEPLFHLLWPDEAEEFLALEDKQEYYNKLKG